MVETQVTKDGASQGLTGLIDATRQLTAGVDLATLLQRFEHASLGALDCERISIFLYDGARGQLCSRLATGVGPIQVPVNCGVVGSAYRMRRVINVPDARADSRFYPAVDRNSGFRTRSLLCIPLLNHDACPIGVLEALNKRGARFTATDEQVGAALGALAGVALERQALLEERATREKVARELGVARQIQQSLLPASPPQLAGFDIAGWSEPSEATGGDFYDYLALPDGRTGIVLADVSGHGLGASLLASECRALIRATAATTGDLATILARTNELLFADLRSERFVTLFLAALEPDASTVEYVSAGHPAQVVQPASSSGPGWRALDSTTMPLGIFPDLGPVRTAIVQLDPGDTLLLMTDGVFELENAASQPLELDGVATIVGRTHGTGAAECLRQLEMALAGFAVGGQQDDMTAVVIRRV